LKCRRASASDPRRHQGLADDRDVGAYRSQEHRLAPVQLAQLLVPAVLALLVRAERLDGVVEVGLALV
jgi:hypothetical protein